MQPDVLAQYSIRSDCTDLSSAHGETRTFGGPLLPVLPVHRHATQGFQQRTRTKEGPETFLTSSADCHATFTSYHILISIASLPSFYCAYHSITSHPTHHARNGHLFSPAARPFPTYLTRRIALTPTVQPSLLSIQVTAAAAQALSCPIGVFHAPRTLPEPPPFARFGIRSVLPPFVLPLVRARPSAHSAAIPVRPRLAGGGGWWSSDPRC